VRSVIVLLAIIAIILILRVFIKSSNVNAAKAAKTLIAILAGGLFLFLLATGRLHWVFALGVAAIPFIKRLLPLLRFLPLVQGLLSRYKATARYAKGPEKNQTSIVTSRFLKMSLDHDSGDLDGEILEGTYRDQQLSRLTLTQLLHLFSEFDGDEESIALLQGYLDRNHTGWQEQANNEQAAAGKSNVNSESADGAMMSRKEAYEILGLNVDANEQQIIESHRRLMQKLHPDVGGSTYLAVKINQAKKILLDK
jgi:hypothetical protein